MNTCSKCKWWESFGDNIHGKCHRRPPTGKWGAEFPSAIHTDWCGEFADKETQTQTQTEENNNNGKVKRNYNRKK